MNRYEFYSNLNSFKSLQHASGSKANGVHEYVAKIDKFYPDGRPRYFYTKEEWDNYQKNAKSASQAGADRGNSERSKYERDKLYKDLAEKGKKHNEEVNNYNKNEKAAKGKELDEQQRWLNVKKENNKLTGIYDPDTERYSKGKMKKGEGFYDKNEETGKGPSIMRSIYSISLGGSDHPLPGTDGYGNKTDYLGYDDKDVENVINSNKPIIDHCLDFYQTYVLDKGDMDDWDFNKEVRNYIWDVVNFCAPSWLRNSDGRLSDSAIGFTQVLEQEIKDRSEKMKKMNDEQKEIDKKKANL